MASHMGGMRRQSKNVIYNVYNYFKSLENCEEKVNVLFRGTQNVVAKACGVSLSTVQRICQEAQQSAPDDVEVQAPAPGPSFNSPRKNLIRVKPVTELDDFEKDVIRRSVQEFYDRGEYPTLKKLRDILKEKINYKGGITSLHKILRKLDFRYRKCNDGRRFLMERKDIVTARVAFLRKMHDIRNENNPRPIIYLDETWVNQNHSRKFIWQDSTKNGGLRIPLGKGSRLIVCHAGSARHGFIEGADLVFQSKSSIDYHQEMNSQVFREWFVNLLRSLDEGSVIVMDNASYHSMLKEKIPSSNTKKADIVSWLQSKNIPHNPSHTIAELLVIVKQHSSNYRTYELDELALQMGHEVVRLPPYHCQYNPLELIWAQVKGEVADKNCTFKIKDVRKLLQDSINNVSVEDWQNCVRHAEALQEEDFVKEGLRDNCIENIIIRLCDDSDDSSDDSSNDDDLDGVESNEN